MQKTDLTNELISLYESPMSADVFNPAAPDPWERLEQENVEAYAAFKYYLTLPKRSFRQVVQYVYSKYFTDATVADFTKTVSTDEMPLFDPKIESPTTKETSGTVFDLARHQKLLEIEKYVESWATAFNWRERCDQYDLYVNDTEAVRKAIFRRKMVWKHIGLSEKMMEVIEQRLDNISPMELEIDDLQKWIKLVVEIQRLAVDASTSNTAIQQNITVSGAVSVTKGLSSADVKEIIKDPEKLDMAEKLIDSLLNSGKSK